MEKNKSQKLDSMKKLVECWEEKFDRNILDVEVTTDGYLLVTMHKGTQLNSGELSWLFKNFSEVIVEAEAGYMFLHLFG